MSLPDAREVDLVESLVTVPDPGSVTAFLERCTVGSRWRVQIRTAEVDATVQGREPLGLIDERQCVCLRLRLDRPVPVEPGLRFALFADDELGLRAAAVVRPWPAG